MCYPTLTEDGIANQIVLTQRLDEILETLKQVEDSLGELHIFFCLQGFLVLTCL